jgi:capsular polysaccharide biosynthesis protein
VRLLRGHAAGGGSAPAWRVGAGEMRRWIARHWTPLTFARQVHAVRAYRWTVVVLALLGGAAAGVATVLQTPVYAASVRLLVSPNLTTGNASKPSAAQLNAAGTYVLQRVRSYTEIANNPETAEVVIARLRLPFSPQQLMANVTVTSRAGTAVLDVEVLDQRAERARDIANAYADTLPDYLGRLETPAGAEHPSVKVTVIQRAGTPGSPRSPQPLMNLALGLAGGFVIGAGAAVVRYARDRAVRDATQAAEVARATLLGTVPDEPLLGQPAAAERYRQLRSDIRLRCAGHGLTGITVTGASTGDGAAAVATNLAIAFARAGETVVLIDADLRSPAVDTLLQVPNSGGLANVLRREQSVNEVSRQWRPDLPLHVLPTGPVEAGEVEKLLQSGELPRLFESFRLGNVFVVVNGLPLLSDAESMLLVRTTDATVLVARTGLTVADHLAAAGDVLRAMEANLLGVVAVERSA